MRLSKVCHITTMTRWGGVERMLVDFLTNPVQKKFNHVLMSTSTKGEIVEPIINTGVPFSQPKRKIHYDPAVIFRMARWLRSKRVQIVHTYNANSTAWGTMAALLAGVPYCVAHEHGSVWTVKSHLLWLNRWAYHRSDLVLANSFATKRMIEHKYKIPEERIRVVYNAVAPLPETDIDQILSDLCLDADFIVGSIGRLDTPKDYSTYIHSAAFILKSHKNIQFVLVGGGPQESRLKELIQELGIQDRFLMTGWRADAREIIQVFDIFVSTSIRESFGNGLIEAALAGKPVIAPRVDGIPEAVIDQATGLLLTPTGSFESRKDDSSSPVPEKVLIDDKFEPPRSLNPHQLADRILYLLQKPVLRNELGRAARRRASIKFSMKRYITDLENIYMELLDEKLT